jgi:hypothetical protein
MPAADDRELAVPLAQVKPDRSADQATKEAAWAIGTVGSTAATSCSGRNTKLMGVRRDIASPGRFETAGSGGVLLKQVTFPCKKTAYFSEVGSLHITKLNYFTE